MSKIRRGGHSAEGETLSAGRVEYLEAARARVRTRRIRRTVIIVAVLTILVLFATGAVGSSIARAKDLVDTAVIALAPAAGWPQQTGITDPDAVAQMSGSFVEMGGDSCVVYSLGGTRLNSIQSGYARPAIAAGKTRFVLYNRSGNELRVESRTQNLYTKTMDSTISLCAVADAGQVAVVTDSTDSVAKLTVYNSSMQQQLVWNLTSEQGTPLRMAFAPDSRRLAVAAVSAVGGQLTTNLYVLPLSQGDPVCLGSENSVPQWMGWMSNGFLLVLYENRAVLYNTSGGSAGERASYDFGGGTYGGFGSSQRGEDLRAEISVSFDEAAFGCEKKISLQGQDGKISTVQVKIPAGIESGKTIRLRGKGMPGSNLAGDGDLLLKVDVQEKPGFERKGADLYTTVKIPFTTAVLGGEAEVATLTGKVVCRIKPGTQSGSRIRLKGKGIVSMKDASVHGDQYVTVQIDVPKNLSAAAKQKLREFEEACKGGSSRGAA